MDSVPLLGCFVISSIFLLKYIPEAHSVLHLSARQERALPLIFPPTAPTRTQLIVGIGIPLEHLLYEAMTTGYVLKAEYFLPSTVDELRVKKLQPINTAPTRSSRQLFGSAKFEKHAASDKELKGSLSNFLAKSERVLTSYRWSVYKGLEGLANRIGLQGRSCVLKSICETAEVPFDYRNGMFAELLHILLTPTTSTDELSEHADNEYYQAEALGRAGAKCERVFKDCKKSLLDQFSDVHTLMENMPNIF